MKNICLYLTNKVSFTFLEEIFEENLFFFTDINYQ